MSFISHVSATFSLAGSYLSQTAHFLYTRPALVIGLGSTSTLCGLGIYRWAKHKQIPPAQVSLQQIIKRVCQTYAYIMGSIALTAITALVCHLSGISVRILQANSLIALALSLIATWGSMLMIKYVPKKEQITRHLAWAIFNASLGVILSPLGFLNKVFIYQGIAMTFGSCLFFSLTALIAPDETFLKFEGPLMAGLATLTLTIVVSSFFPTSNLASLASKASLYGGLGLFYGLLVVETQRVIKQAKAKKFDAFSASTQLYLNILNIFNRVVGVFSERNKLSNQT